MSGVVALLGACSSQAPPTPRDSDSGEPWVGARTVRDGWIVVRGTVTADRLEAVAGYARTAVARVRAVWGASVLSGRVVIEVPKDEAEFRARGGSAEAGAQIAATTTADGRVVLAPALFTAVTAQGRVAVLTHELTHVALHQSGLTGVAHWIIEGSAEFTAYRASGLTLAQLAPAVATAVRAGRAPTGPPADADFTARPAAAYQEAFVWCRFLVHRFGRAGFVRFVRAADERRAGAFATSFGVGPGALRAPYTQFLRTRLGSTAEGGR